ncbi:MAG TPA: cytochrome b562 [Tepidisphaeraceae bacterium]|jgi:hypothetical protein
MNQRQWFFGICAGMLAAAPALAQSTGSLHHEMQAMGGDLKVLSQQINDAPSNESSLKLITDMEQHTMAAKGLTPPSIEHAPEADRPKLLAKFRGEMTHVIQAELEMEQALLDNDNAKAADMINKLKDLMRQGHHDFKHR